MGAEVGTDFYDDDRAHHWNTSTAKDPHLTSEELHDAVDGLDERNRKCINMLYFEGLTGREVGEVLGVTESRISQLHKTSLQGLRQILARPEIMRNSI